MVFTLLRLVYFIRVALNSIRRNLVLNFVSAATISMALLILCSFLLLYTNLRQIVESTTTELSITVYLKDGLSAPAAEKIEEKIANLNGVENVVFISKDQALDDMRLKLGDQSGILEGLEENPLPASLELSLKPHMKEDASISRLTSAVKAIKGVDEVHYAWEWAEKLNVFIRFVKLSGLTVGLMLFLAIVFIIANTIKLTVLARKDELYIMRLVGATENFIRTPFYIEGIVQGLAGGLIALVLLFAGFHLILANIQLPLGLSLVELKFLPIGLIWFTIFSGFFLGFIGSFISLGRFMQR